MKKKKSKPKPLEAIEGITYNYPDIWDKVDPSDFNTVQKFCEDNKILNSIYLVAALSKWQQSKQIFEIDAELCNVLAQTDKTDEEIPVEAIENLMFDCFYVKLPNDYITITKLVSNQGEYGSFVVDGFFYFVSQKNEMKSINIVLLLTTGYSFSLGCDVHNGLSLRECIDRKMNVNSYVYKVMNLFMQIILYMSAVNADVEEDSVQKEIRERAVKKETSEEKTNQTDKKTTNNEISYRELQKWNVGYRYGSAVKKARQAEHKKRDINTEQEQTARQGSHSRKRTHARRGHFHHFWTGSRNGERHLIVKWVSPIIVNAEYDNIVTIRKVK